MSADLIIQIVGGLVVAGVGAWQFVRKLSRDTQKRDDDA